MDYSINVLYDSADYLCRQLLRDDEEYTSLYAKNEDEWKSFCEKYSDEVKGMTLELLGDSQHLDYLRQQYFLLVGFHMGLELGNSSAIFVG